MRILQVSLVLAFAASACTTETASDPGDLTNPPTSVDEEIEFIEHAQSLSQSTAAAAGLANCTCYYTYDEECPIGWACSEMFGNFGCQRRDTKGGTLAGGCTADAPGRGACTKDSDCRYGAPCINKSCMKKVAPCDGQCAPAGKGTVCGIEDPKVLADFASAWGGFVIERAVAGGGKIGVDVNELGARFGLTEECSFYLSRASLGLTELCLGADVIQHPSEEHKVEEHTISEIAADECQQRIAAGCSAMLVDGLREPSNRIDPLQYLPPECGAIRASRGCFGLAPEACLTARLDALVLSLTTPQGR